MKAFLKFTVDKEFRRKIDILKRTDFFIGFRKSGKAGKKVKNDITLVQVAIFNHFGTKDIPARPFLLNIYTKQKLILKKQKETLASILLRNEPMEQSLQRMANYLAKLGKDVMSEWETPPNAYSTIAQKGFNDPLIWSGKLRSSLEGWYVINKKTSEKKI